MALKIRCPHCQRILTAEDDTAGQGKLCPACGRGFTVPIPVGAAAPRVEVAAACPGCGNSVAPGTSICPACHLNLRTGRKAPLTTRLRRLTLRFWIISVTCVVVSVFVGFISTHYYIQHLRKTDRPIKTFEPVVRTPVVAGPAVSRLFAARTPAQRRAARDELATLRSDATEEIAAALSASLEKGGASAITRANQRTAMQLIAESGEKRWIALLEDCQKQPELRDDATLGRALLGDEAVLDATVEGYLVRLRRALFLQKVLTLLPHGGGGGQRAITRDAVVESDSFADALRRLGPPALSRLAGAWWTSWAWLGQDRGDGFAEQLFAIAKPPVDPRHTGSPAEETAERVRAARRALDQVGQTASPAAQAAALLTLAQCAPQYKAVRERIVAGLVSALPDCSAADQQRIVWTLARLYERNFGDATAGTPPASITVSDLLAVLEWARAQNLGALKPGWRPATLAGAMPDLSIRVITPQRQLERDLLLELDRGWEAVPAALQRWQSAGLGCTPRIVALIEPGNRAPQLPALAAALALAAESDETDVRRRLDLWRQATDQPAWVRALAATSLAAGAARRGTVADWPAELDAAAIESLPPSVPAGELFGRALSAGGAAYLLKLESARGTPLTDAQRAKLLRLAQEALRDRAGSMRR